MLPPTVLGFYLLVAMGPAGPLGKTDAGGRPGTLPFTFAGLVLASCLYSLPFVVQASAERLYGNSRAPAGSGSDTAHRRSIPSSTSSPLARPGFLTAAVLGFAHRRRVRRGADDRRQHPGEDARRLGADLRPRRGTRVPLQAHCWPAACLVFSFVVLLALYTLNPAMRRQT